jgi:hypothetical protein
MQAALVIKTANGYAVVPYEAAPAAVAFGDLFVATSLGSGYSSGDTVLCALREVFEKPVAKLAEAA